MSIKGIENGRASFAYEKAEEGSKNKGIAKEYRSHCDKIPMMIKTNGLGNMLAFILSKSEKDKAYNLLYEQIGEWLYKNENKHILNLESEPKEDRYALIKAVINAKSPKYKLATIEVLSLFNWLRRFAKGLIEE